VDYFPMAAGCSASYSVGCFVEQDKLDASQCRMRWRAAEPLLRRAASSFINLRAGAGFPVASHVACL